VCGKRSHPPTSLPLRRKNKPFPVHRLSPRRTIRKHARPLRPFCFLLRLSVEKSTVAAESARRPSPFFLIFDSIPLRRCLELRGNLSQALQVGKPRPTRPVRAETFATSTFEADCRFLSFFFLAFPRAERRSRGDSPFPPMPAASGRAPFQFSTFPRPPSWVLMRCSFLRRSRGPFRLSPSFLPWCSTWR